MNFREKQFNKYNLRNQLKYSSKSGTRQGCAKCWKGTTHRHWRVLSDIVWKLVNQGYEVYPEAEFVTGGRADIVAISQNGDGYAIEVLDSETDKRFNLKKEYYPCEFELIKVRTKEFDISDWDL